MPLQGFPHHFLVVNNQHSLSAIMERLVLGVVANQYQSVIS
mgnify:CR=1 FL=1